MLLSYISDKSTIERTWLPVKYLELSTHSDLHRNNSALRTLKQPTFAELQVIF